jgi:ADP-heptose:LPS heptosyltransferase
MNRDILVHLKQAGAGDYVQFRCVLGDLKRAHPGRHVVVAAQPRYHDLLKCHPDIDQLVDLNVNPDHYAYCYDLDRACSLSSIHGTNTIDYFAMDLGVNVTTYDMKFRLSKNEYTFADILTHGRPTVGFAPVSSTKARDLTPEARQGVCESLLEQGWQVLLLHEYDLPDLPGEVLRPQLNFRQVIAAWHAVKAGIAVDTSHVHLSGGIGKPTLGIFSTQCVHIYTKHYPKCKVLQRHPRGTKCHTPDITGITAQEIMTEFKKLEIK